MWQDTLGCWGAPQRAREGCDGTLTRGDREGQPKDASPALATYSGNTTQRARSNWMACLSVQASLRITRLFLFVDISRQHLPRGPARQLPTATLQAALPLCHA